MKFEKSSFEERISKALALVEDLAHSKSSSTTLSLPVPAANYCQICKCRFECYFTHVKDESHRAKSEESKANAYIADFCKDFSSKIKPPKKQNRNIKKAKTPVAKVDFQCGTRSASKKNKKLISDFN